MYGCPILSSIHPKDRWIPSAGLISEGQQHDPVEFRAIACMPGNAFLRIAERTLFYLRIEMSKLLRITEIGIGDPHICRMRDVFPDVRDGPSPPRENDTSLILAKPWKSVVDASGMHIHPLYLRCSIVRRHEDGEMASVAADDVADCCVVKRE